MCIFVYMHVCGFVCAILWSQYSLKDSYENMYLDFCVFNFLSFCECLRIFNSDKFVKEKLVFLLQVS